MTSLVKIEGSRVSRFDGNRLIEARDMDMTGMPGEHRRQHIEFIRQHGFKGYDPTLPELVFDRIAREALRAGMVDLDETTLRALWDAYDGTNDPDGYDAADVQVELNRRGLGDYCRI